MIVPKDEIYKELESLLLDIPGFSIGGYFQSNGRTLAMDLDQNQLDDSIFAYNYTDSKVLHFTTLNSCKLILESRYLRASNYTQFIDKNELLHALSITKHMYPGIDEKKKYLFAACFTPLVKPMSYENYSFHWENYANNSRGVALEFEISRIPLKAFYYSLRVHYLSASDQNDLLTQLSSKKIIDVVIESLFPILGSIKEPSFVNEREIRLVYNPGQEILRTENQNKEFDFNLGRDNSIEYFAKLPFDFKPRIDGDDSIMTLKTIHIGKEAEINDGQRTLLEHIIPIYDKRGVQFKWVS